MEGQKRAEGEYRLAERHAGGTWYRVQGTGYRVQAEEGASSVSPNGTPGVYGTGYRVQAEEGGEHRLAERHDEHGDRHGRVDADHEIGVIGEGREEGEVPDEEEVVEGDGVEAALGALRWEGGVSGQR